MLMKWQDLSLMERKQRLVLSDTIIQIKSSCFSCMDVVKKNYGEVWGIIDDGKGYLFTYSFSTTKIPDSMTLERMHNVHRFSIVGQSDLQLRKGEFVEFWFFITKI